MKRILITLLLVLPLCAMAKSKDDSKYLAGAVPEVDGQIVFSKSFRVTGKTQEEIVNVLGAWANGLVEASIPAPGNYARIMESTDSSIVARVCEWLVFKSKPLYLDRARFRFQMDVNVTGDHVSISAYTLTYYYSENNDGENGTLIKAEEWISDKEALNKAQTKLYPKSGKFRRRTVDRMESLFESAMDAFTPAQEAAPVEKPVRQGIVEE